MATRSSLDGLRDAMEVSTNYREERVTSSQEFRELFEEEVQFAVERGFDELRDLHLAAYKTHGHRGAACMQPFGVDMMIAREGPRYETIGTLDGALIQVSAEYEDEHARLAIRHELAHVIQFYRHNYTTEDDDVFVSLTQDLYTIRNDNHSEWVTILQADPLLD